MVGRQLGHYRILSEIGRGGMGVVFRARDEVLHRDVALKVLAERTVADQPARAFLLHEARAASALNHPNICVVHDVVESDDDLCIVMELIEGRSLSAIIAAGGSGLAVDAVLRYGVQVAAALNHAHGRNIVHRDLKSHNVAVTAEGLVKVLDFGLARRLPGEAYDGATQTVGPLEGSSALAGTLSYMAPELLRGAEGDARSDVWALGIVLYEAASGQLPFRAKTGFELSSEILNSQPAAPQVWLPPGLMAVIHRCLVKDPVGRYQRASEVQAALESVQSSAMSAPAQATPPPRDPKNPSTIVLRGMKHLSFKKGDVLLMAGTTKGAFLLRSNAKRAQWDVAGPYFHGRAVFTMAFDGRAGRHSIWAAANQYGGASLLVSNDFGRTWTNRETPIRYPVESGLSAKSIWKIVPGREEEPGVLYCGVEPAALFRTADAGENWSIVRGLFDHPHRPRWEPGNGGLCLHTILPDPANPARILVAVSAAGVYVTEDGGATWQARNRGVRVVFRPERYPEFGQCVHRVAMHPAHPNRLFLQNHWGLYRSDDGAESWQDIANGIPYEFGFAMTVHPKHPEWVYIIPVESDEFRCSADGRLRVYRTRNGGKSWEALTRGLPQKGSYTTVLREGLVADSLDAPGIYFGTRSGELYLSTDDGRNWRRILEGLPPVTCVQAAQIAK